MKRFSLFALAASLVINASALGVIATGIDASSLPQGTVVITELDVSAQAPVYAQVADASGVEAVAL